MNPFDLVTFIEELNRIVRFSPPTVDVRAELAKRGYTDIQINYGLDRWGAENGILH